MSNDLIEWLMVLEHFSMEVFDILDISAYAIILIDVKLHECEKLSRSHLMVFELIFNLFKTVNIFLDLMFLPIEETLFTYQIVVRLKINGLNFLGYFLLTLEIHIKVKLVRMT